MAGQLQPAGQISPYRPPDKHSPCVYSCFLTPTAEWRSCDRVKYGLAKKYWLFGLLKKKFANSFRVFDRTITCWGNPISEFWKTEQAAWQIIFSPFISKCLKVKRSLIPAIQILCFSGSSETQWRFHSRKGTLKKTGQRGMSSVFLKTLQKGDQIASIRC